MVEVAKVPAVPTEVTTVVVPTTDVPTVTAKVSAMTTEVTTAVVPTTDVPTVSAMTAAVAPTMSTAMTVLGKRCTGTRGPSD